MRWDTASQVMGSSSTTSSSLPHCLHLPWDHPPPPPRPFHIACTCHGIILHHLLVPSTLPAPAMGSSSTTSSSLPHCLHLPWDHPPPPPRPFHIACTCHGIILHHLLVPSTLPAPAMGSSSTTSSSLPHCLHLPWDHPPPPPRPFHIACTCHGIILHHLLVPSTLPAPRVCNLPCIMKIDFS